MEKAPNERAKQGESNDGFDLFLRSGNSGMSTGIVPLCFKTTFPFNRFLYCFLVCSCTETWAGQTSALDA